LEAELAGKSSTVTTWSAAFVTQFNSNPDVVFDHCLEVCHIPKLHGSVVHGVLDPLLTGQQSEHLSNIVNVY
jgi:hypothetical protein